MLKLRPQMARTLTWILAAAATALLAGARGQEAVVRALLATPWRHLEPRIVV